MVFPGAIEVWNGSMELFPIPPTSLGGACRIIDVQYYLRVIYFQYVDIKIFKTLLCTGKSEYV
jgi:hypothetical protein